MKKLNSFKLWTGTAVLLLSGALYAQPPDLQQGIDACNGLSQGNSCNMPAPNGDTVNGTCTLIESQLACQPEGGNTQPPSSGDTCNNLSEGDSCELQTPDGPINGACTVINNQLVCRPEGDNTQPPGGGDTCNNLSEGDSCEVQTPNGPLNGACTVINNQLVCQPEAPPGAFYDFDTATLRLQGVDAGYLGLYDVSMGLTGADPITFDLNEVTPTTSSAQPSAIYEPATGLLSIHACSVGEDVLGAQLQQQDIPGVLRFVLISTTPASDN